jgi:hypothetical protein
MVMSSARASVAIAIAIGGTAVASFSPAATFVWFRAHVIGMPDPRTEPFVLEPGQRIVAVLGAWLAAGALLWVGRRPAVTLGARRGRWMVATCAAFVATVFLNARWAGVQLGLWDFFLPWLGLVYVPAVVAFGACAFGLMGLEPWKALRPRSALCAAAFGAGYGGFSGLWHCCAPLGAGNGPVPWPLALLALTGWAIAFCGFVAIHGARLRAPRGEALGAILFAVGYPWHTPLWFVQGLIGGVFAVWLARRSESVVAPGIFLATAYTVHTTVPFAVAGG